MRAGVASASNLFMRRRIFEVMGPFRKDMASKSDWEYCLRARDAGIQLQYCETAVVRHEVIATWGGLWRSKLRLARGMLRLGVVRGRDRRAMRREALRELRLPLRTMLRALRAERPIGTRVGLAAAIVVARVGYVVGWVMAELRAR